MAIALIFPLGVLLVFFWRMRPVKHRKGLPYRSRRSLLSAAELRYFHVLVAAVPPTLHVFSKVRLADLVSWPSNAWREFGAPVSGKHLDFVIADQDSRILACVELDDRSHDRRDRRQRDAFVDDVLSAAGIPVVHVKAAARYDIRELTGSILRALRS